jgi:hypothetical protein
MTILGDELWALIFDYLEIVVLKHIYDSMGNSIIVRRLMGKCLHSLHSGTINHESKSYELQNKIYSLDESNGFLTWIFNSKFLQSLKLYFNEKIDHQSIGRFLSIIGRRFLSGYLCELECCVLVICQYPLSIELLDAILDLQLSISAAYRSGKITKLTEITISYDCPTDNHSNTYIEVLCPQLKVLDRYSYKAIFSALDVPPLFDSSLFESSCFSSIESLDLSEAISSMMANSGQQLEAVCASLVSNLSKGLFPFLRKVSIKCPGPDLDYNTDILLYFVIACADYYYCDTYIHGRFFGLQISTFEIDVTSLDANEHFNSSQAWADLVRKYDPLIGTNDFFPSNKGGLFPGLEVLRCNHWLPSGQIFRLFCGSKRGRDMNYKRQLHLEISPGAEDPCFSSFLINTWHPEELHIHTLLIRRKRRLIHGMMTHFYDTDNFTDSLDDMLNLDEFQDEYVVEVELPLSNAENYSCYEVVNSALYRAMREGKLASVRELGILEDYLRFLGCFRDNISDENTIDGRVIYVFKSCIELKVLRIYLDNERRKPTNKDRVQALSRALLVFLRGLASHLILRSEKQQELQKEEATTHLSDSSLSQEEKRMQGSPLDLVVIDIPSRKFFSLLRANLLEIMESLSFLKSERIQSYLRGKAEENEDASHSQNRQSFVLRIEFGSCQSHSFNYICDLGNEYLNHETSQLPA